MSHPFTPYRQVVSNDSAVELRALTVQTILSFARGNLPCLTQLSREIEDESQIRLNALGGRLISGANQHWIETPSCHLVSFGRESKTIGEHDSSGCQRGLNDRLDQIGSRSQVQKELGDRSDGMLRIEECLASDFGSASASRL